MRKSLRDVLFGFRTKRNVDKAAAIDAAAAKKEKTLATINETDTVQARPHVYRTIGLTEARLRARNQQSWMTSTKGWSDFLGRFTRSAKV